jgi:hypothetical protein
VSVRVYADFFSLEDVHAGYGEQWIKTLKAAIEIMPNPL